MKIKVSYTEYVTKEIEIPDRTVFDLIESDYESGYTFIREVSNILQIEDYEDIYYVETKDGEPLFER